MDERAEIGLRAEQRRRSTGDRLEQHDAGGEIRRHDGADVPGRHRVADCRLVALPGGRPDDEIDAAPREHRRILHDDVGRRKIDGDVHRLPGGRVGTAAVARRLRIDDADDLAAVLRGDRLDHPSHFAVSDQQNLEQLSTLTLTGSRLTNNSQVRY